jgi:hypothetical protein
LVNALRQAFLKDSRYRMSFERRAGLICFSTAIISVLLHAMVDFPLQIDAIRPLFAAMVGSVFAMTSTSANTSRRDRKDERTRVRE